MSPPVRTRMAETHRGRRDEWTSDRRGTNEASLGRSHDTPDYTTTLESKRIESIWAIKLLKQTNRVDDTSHVATTTKSFLRSRRQYVSIRRSSRLGRWVSQTVQHKLLQLPVGRLGQGHAFGGFRDVRHVDGNAPAPQTPPVADNPPQQSAAIPTGSCL